MKHSVFKSASLQKIMQRIPHAIEVSVAHNPLNSVDKKFKSCFSLRLFSAILMPLRAQCCVVVTNNDG